jgi:hypothetical protein
MLMVGLAGLLLSCSGSDPTGTSTEPQQLVGSMESHSDCKVFDTPGAVASLVPLPDCVQFSYDGSDTLHITRINAAFNCCPDSLYIECSLNDNVITIVEKEDLTSGGCDCICLFDMEYTISGVEPGQYTIRIVEPYRPEDEGNPQLQFSVDLTVTPSGSFCVDRDGYPWGFANTWQGSVILFDGCQADPARLAVQAVDNCIAYVHDGSSLLTIEHSNAVFNCCADSAAVTVRHTRDTLFIEESQYFVHDNPCRCVCPYDLTYEIPEVLPGAYTVLVIGPYAVDLDDTLSFEIDLRDAPSGSYCVAWPW